MKTIILSEKDSEFLEAHINPRGIKIPIEVCKYCGDKEGDVPFATDHIVPRVKGGSEDPENKQRICWRCNQAKGIDDEKTFMEWIDRVRKNG